MRFKDNLRRERTRANLSQEKLAEKMSVSRQTISKWENGGSYPSTGHIFALTKILSCSMDKLIDNKPSIKQPASVIPHKKYVYLVAGAITIFLFVIFGLAFLNFFGSKVDNLKINQAKVAIFDKIINDSLDETVAIDGYVEKKIVGYGIAEENGTFYVKCDLYGDDTSGPCSAIIYFCEDNGYYSYKCQYLDDPDYIPRGEYYEID